MVGETAFLAAAIPKNVVIVPFFTRVSKLVAHKPMRLIGNLAFDCIIPRTLTLICSMRAVALFVDKLLGKGIRTELP